MDGPRERCGLHTFAALQGYAWRHAKHSGRSPDLREPHANLLKVLGSHIRPQPHKSAHENLVHIRPELRGIEDLLALLAGRPCVADCSRTVACEATALGKDPACHHSVAEASATTTTSMPSKDERRKNFMTKFYGFADTATKAVKEGIAFEEKSDDHIDAGEINQDKGIFGDLFSGEGKLKTQIKEDTALEEKSKVSKGFFGDIFSSDGKLDLKPHARLTATGLRQLRKKKKKPDDHIDAPA